MRSEGEQFDKACRLPQVPFIVLYSSRPYRNAEAPEQPDAYRLGSLVRWRTGSRYAFIGSRWTHLSWPSPFSAELNSCVSYLLSYRIRAQDNDSPMTWQVKIKCIRAKWASILGRALVDSGVTRRFWAPISRTVQNPSAEVLEWFVTSTFGVRACSGCWSGEWYQKSHNSVRGPRVVESIWLI
jgi:hypothetical protein